VQQGEPEHIDRPRGETDESDERHHNEQHRRRSGCHQCCPRHHQSKGEYSGPIDLVLENRRGHHAQSHPGAESEQDEVEIGRITGNHLVHEDFSERHQHSATHYPGSQTDVDGTNYRVHGDELPTLAQLPHRATQIEAPPFARFSLRR